MDVKKGKENSMSTNESSEILLPAQARCAAFEQADGAACIAMLSARIVRLSPARPRHQTVMVRISAPHGRSRPFALRHEALEKLVNIAMTLERDD